MYSPPSFTAMKSLSVPQNPFPSFLRQRIDYFQQRMTQNWGGESKLRGRAPHAADLLLNSNDYLAITTHEDIISAQIDILRREGNGPMRSAIFLQDEMDPQRALERWLAADFDADESILTQSGWCANVGLIQSIANERTPVYIDQLAHASLWEGAKSAGAKPIPVHHNNPDHLERQIMRHGAGIVAVDSVYSTTGSMCPLREYASIANDRGCIFVVDEAHSLGTHGDKGEGLVASLGLTHQVHFRTASLAKTYVGRAGIIICNTEFKRYFAFEALPAIFSSTLLPHDLAGLEAAHNVIRREAWRRDRLHNITHVVRSRLLELGYPITNGTEQIIGLEVGTEPDVMKVRDIFEANGVFGAVFFAPATPTKRALVRLTLHAGLSDADVDRLITTLAAIRDEVRLDAWSATRRANRASAAEIYRHHQEAA